MTEPIYVCPECGSDRVTTEHHQKFMANTGDHCEWMGERRDLKKKGDTP